MEQNLAVLLHLILLSCHWVQGHEGYANVLAEQLNQYCDLHNRCPSPSSQSRPAVLAGKAGPRGLRGPPGAAGKVNYTAVKEEVHRQLTEMGFDGRLDEILGRLSSLERTLSVRTRKNCLGLDKSDALIQNNTGGVFEIGGLDVVAYCDLTTAGGGWMVFQRRMDGSENFERDWDDYVNGFGRPERELWLGLEKLHRITTTEEHEMRVDLEDWDGNRYHASYTTFSIGNSGTSYTLTVGGYSGNAGDSMEYHSGHRFYTADSDNSRSCARNYGGAWWYDNCFYSNLNGVYMTQWKYTATYSHGVEWWHLKRANFYSLKFSEMKIRPKRSD